jgi:long-chain acyl-CoA synthetase
VPGVEVRVADDGELLVRGPTVFAGYWGRPDATAETIDAQGWLHTGDVGEFTDDGHLRLTDRKKDIIITAGGKNLSPSEIENRVKVSPYVKEAVVIGDARRYVTALVQIEHDTVANWAQRQGIAFTTFRDLTERDEVRALIGREIDAANRDLARVEQVKAFRLLPRALDQDDAELTATQKVRRAVVAERYAGLVEEMYP